jgi:hypothetical protein
MRSFLKLVLFLHAASSLAYGDHSLNVKQSLNVSYSPSVSPTAERAPAKLVERLTIPTDVFNNINTKLPLFTEPRFTGASLCLVMKPQAFPACRGDDWYACACFSHPADYRKEFSACLAERKYSQPDMDGKSQPGRGPTDVPEASKNLDQLCGQINAISTSLQAIMDKTALPTALPTGVASTLDSAKSSIAAVASSIKSDKLSSLLPTRSTAGPTSDATASTTLVSSEGSRTSASQPSRSATTSSRVSSSAARPTARAAALGVGVGVVAALAS